MLLFAHGVILAKEVWKGRQDTRTTFGSRIPVGRFLIVRLLYRSSRVGSDVHPCTAEPKKCIHALFPLNAVPHYKKTHQPP